MKASGGGPSEHGPGSKKARPLRRVAGFHPCKRAALAVSGATHPEPARQFPHAPASVGATSKRSLRSRVYISPRPARGAPALSVASRCRLRVPGDARASCISAPATLLSRSCWSGTVPRSIAVSKRTPSSIDGFPSVLSPALHPGCECSTICGATSRPSRSPISLTLMSPRLAAARR